MMKKMQDIATNLHDVSERQRAICSAISGLALQRDRPLTLMDIEKLADIGVTLSEQASDLCGRIQSAIEAHH